MIITSKAINRFDAKNDNLNTYFDVDENYQTDKLNWIADGAQNKPEKYL